MGNGTCLRCVSDTPTQRKARAMGRDADRPRVAMSRPANPRRGVAVAALVVCAALCPSAGNNIFARAQMDLVPTIQAAAGWPCVSQVFETCAVPFPSGGLTPTEWYDATRWDKASYVPLVDAETGEATGEAGESVSVGTAFALFAALENRDVKTVFVTNGFTLPDLHNWRWPDEGYPVRRDVVIVADPGCATRNGRDEEAEEDAAEEVRTGDTAPAAATPATTECIIDCGQKTFLVLTDGGGVVMSGLTLKNGGGRLGGFINVRPGGAATFDKVVFDGGSFRGARSLNPNRVVTPKPNVPGVTNGDGTTPSYGGAVFVVNDDRSRTEAELLAARAAVAGTTAADSVTAGVPHNVTFSKCVFLANSAPHGDGGAVYARTSGLGFVIFDDCLFQGNSADFGSGGAVAAVGGRIIFHDSIFVGNVAKNAGAVSLNWGGLVGGCLFSNNVALGGSGGAVFAAQADLNPTETVKNTPNVQQPGRIQNSKFDGNAAAVAGGAVFSVGGWRFWNNEYGTGVPNTVTTGNAEGGDTIVPHPDVYACSVETGGSACVAYTPETEFAQIPEYAPFATQNLPQAVYVRPAAVVEAAMAVETNSVSGIVRPANSSEDEAGVGSDSSTGGTGTGSDASAASAGAY